MHPSQPVPHLRDDLLLVPHFRTQDNVVGQHRGHLATVGHALAGHRREQLLTLYGMREPTQALARELTGVVDLARRMTGAETSQLNVLGVEHQLTVHEAGTPGPDPSVPLSNSVCATVLDHRGADPVIVIPDTAADPVLRDHPAVTGPSGIRFYAGVPLTSTHGWPIGMLCAHSSTPRDLDDLQRGLLRQLGHAAMYILENQRRNATGAAGRTRAATGGIAAGNS